LEKIPIIVKTDAYNIIIWYRYRQVKRRNIGKWIFFYVNGQHSMMAITFAVMFDFISTTHCRASYNRNIHTVFSKTHIKTEKYKAYMTLIKKEKFLTPIRQRSVSCQCIYNYIYILLPRRWLGGAAEERFFGALRVNGFWKRALIKSV